MGKKKIVTKFSFKQWKKNLQFEAFIEVRIQGRLLNLGRLFSAIEESGWQKFNHYERITQTYIDFKASSVERRR